MDYTFKGGDALKNALFPLGNKFFPIKKEIGME